tara:strand:- start:199 stop:1026 length:828 start_codon:yes stop_codon:yes gene_type:complete
MTESNEFDEFFQSGNKKVAQFDTEGAISDYTKALEIRPGSGIIYRYRGLAKKEAGNLEGAIEDWVLGTELKDQDSINLLLKHFKYLSIKYLFKKRILLINDSITNEIANQIVAQILHLDSQDSNKSIYLFVNSAGGNLYGSLGICETMKNSTANIYSICWGITAGSATLILASGTKGKRSSCREGKIAFNLPSIPSETPNLKSVEVEEYSAAQKIISQELREVTNQNIQRIIEDAKYWDKNQDNFLTPQEAISYGIIDNIVDDNFLIKILVNNEK